MFSLQYWIKWIQSRLLRIHGTWKTQNYPNLLWIYLELLGRFACNIFNNLELGSFLSRNLNLILILVASTMLQTQKKLSEKYFGWLYSVVFLHCRCLNARCDSISLIFRFQNNQQHQGAVEFTVGFYNWCHCWIPKNCMINFKISCLYIIYIISD